MRMEQAALDDPDVIRAADPAGMLRLVSDLGGQLERGFAIGREASGLPSAEHIRSIAVCGMGGSGIAGDVLRGLYAPRLPFPVAVVKGYGLPEFCGRDTLVVAISFSGNTEETVAAYAQAVDRGCRVVAVSGRGRLAELAVADQVAHVPLPPEAPPVPRAALGYLAGSVIGALDALGVIPPAAADVERTAVVLGGLGEELGPEQPVEGNEAKRIAGWLLGRTPVVWGSEGLAEPAALRWKNQMNENAKVPAFWNVVPELDHNEIEGWSGHAGGSFAAVLLRHRGEDPPNALRMEATVETVTALGLEVREVHARGTGPLDRLFSLIMVGDFASAYLAVLRGVDPAAIPVLTGLKERLRR
jgi:glucose/mannose-6-phosphate isomerase